MTLSVHTGQALVTDELNKQRKEGLEVTINHRTSALHLTVA